MKLNKNYIIAAGAACAALAVYLILNVFTGSLSYKWENGAAVRYNIHTTDTISADIPGTKPLYKRITFKGILNMRILEVKKDQVRTAIQIEPVTISIEGQRDLVAEKLYSTIFIADISKDGEFLKFNFSNEISPDDEKNIINTIRTFQCIIRKGFMSKWSVEETDANGKVIANYRLDDGKVTKRKESYADVISRDGRNDSGSSIEIKRSEYRATYDEKETWLTSMEGGELLTFLSDGKLYLTTSSHVQLKRIYGDTLPDIALWDKNLDFDSLIAKWSSSPKNTIPVALRGEMEQFKKKIGNKTPEVFFTDIFTKHKTFTSSAIHDIMDYIRLYPEISDQVAEYLLKHDINEQQRAMLTHALGRVGHAKAQEALVRIINGKDFKKDNRVQAIMAFSKIPAPEKESINALWETCNQPDKDLVSTAVLSLGSIASKLGKNDDGELKEQSDEIKERLASDLKAEQDTKKRIALIHAAGNTGDSEFIDPISAFLGNESPNVRSSAASALSHIKDKEVDDILCDRLKSEENISVRGSLVSALEQREPAENSVNTVFEQLNREDNDIVRGGMYRYLVKNRDYPGVREKLTELKKTERTLENRKMITRALSSGVASR